MEDVEKQRDITELQHHISMLGDYQRIVLLSLLRKPALPDIPAIEQELSTLRDRLSEAESQLAEKEREKDQQTKRCVECGEFTYPAYPYCGNCGDKKEKRITDLQSRLATALEALKRLEWNRGLSHTCSACDIAEIQYVNGVRVIPPKHKPDCWLSAALEKIGGEVKDK